MGRPPLLKLISYKVDKEKPPLNTSKVRLFAIAMGIVLLSSAYYRVHSASIMADSAIAFLNSLTPEQRAQATF